MELIPYEILSGEISSYLDFDDLLTMLAVNKNILARTRKIICNRLSSLVGKTISYKILSECKKVEVNIKLRYEYNVCYINAVSDIITMPKEGLTFVLPSEYARGDGLVLPLSDICSSDDNPEWIILWMIVENQLKFSRVEQTPCKIRILIFIADYGGFNHLR